MPPQQTANLAPPTSRLARTPGAGYVAHSMDPHGREDGDVEGLMGQFRAYLTKKGLKSTRQRDIIAEKFFSHTGHVSIEELLGLARQDYPRLGYATVYRTLKLLTECGLAAERRFGEGQTMYEAAGDLEHHDHLICIECGHVLEFHNEAIEREQERVARSFGFTVIRHRHELYGLCPRARGIKGGSCPGDDARTVAQGHN
jgi:Fur family ferric uptake transcriptional regulator